uniref:Uncharacterized protein n=1 Tax=Globisporangium ultimum (strain ATCC 200006 / CBS 805.95 / DAOM BR144) TaxID=431595 RepID=K3W7N0_GLOUD
MPLATTQQYFSIAHAIQSKSTNPQATCCYPSKPCMNPRVVKRDGNLHRFCEFHRTKANKNQRALQRRRLVDHMVEQLPIDAYMQQLNEQYELLVGQEQGCAELPPSDLLVRLDLDEDDLRVLAAVLSVDDDDDDGESTTL